MDADSRVEVRTLGSVSAPFADAYTVGENGAVLLYLMWRLLAVDTCCMSGHQITFAQHGVPRWSRRLLCEVKTKYLITIGTVSETLKFKMILHHSH